MRIVDDAPACALVVVEHVHKNLIPALVVRLAVAVKRRAPERLAEKRPHDVRPLVVNGLDNLCVVASDVHLHRNDPELQPHGAFQTIFEQDAHVKPKPTWLVDEIECPHQRAVILVECIGYARLMHYMHANKRLISGTN